MVSSIKTLVQGFSNWDTQENCWGYSSKFLVQSTSTSKIFESSLCLSVASAYSLIEDSCFFALEINFTKAIILSIFDTKNNVFLMFRCLRSF